MWLPTLLLVIALAALAVVVWRGQKQYALFKTYTETRDRQRYYARLLIGSLMLFGVGSLAALAALGRLGMVRDEPPAFLGLTWALQAAAPVRQVAGGGALMGFLIGACIGVGGLTVIAAMRRARGRSTRGGAIMLGDIAPLLPRNGIETLYGGLISINAGVCEELYFRLLLPLLIVMLTGNVALAFVTAGVIFGLAHIYQGWVGVAATMVVGFVLTALYLWTGWLWAAMAIHAGFDLIGLVIRPTLMRLLTARTGRTAA